jgi:heparanase
MAGVVEELELVTVEAVAIAHEEVGDEDQGRATSKDEDVGAEPPCRRRFHVGAGYAESCFSVPHKAGCRSAIRQELRCKARAVKTVVELGAMKTAHPLVSFVFIILTSATLPLAAQMNPRTMPKIGRVDPRFQSYNVEMVEVIGGRFWKPYSSTGVATASTSATPGGIDPALFEQRTPIDLSNPRLRKLASALGPAYVRVSGTWANTIFSFEDSDSAAPTAPPAGFGGVLTRAEWKGVVEFAKAVDAEIVTSFSTGLGTRDAKGVWTPVEAKKFLAYNQSIGGTIAAAEFMNEPTFVSAAGVPAGYDGAAYGRDFAVFQPFFRKAAPNAILLGPGSVGEGIDFVPAKLLPSKELLTAMGPNPVDVFSYHFYGAISERCGTGLGAKSTTSRDAALSEDWLSRTGKVEEFYAGLRDSYAPGKPMWLTETGQTACGGDRWASTFLDTFRYVDQMGQLARRSVQVIMHNTLAASDYGLIDEKTLVPRPNYWAALLWHTTMGETVLDAGTSPSNSVRIYAQCMKGTPGGVTLLALNLSRTDPQTIKAAEASVRYTLTAPGLESHMVELNGKNLKVSESGDVPKLEGVGVAKGSVTMPPESITFLAMVGAGNAACR